MKSFGPKNIQISCMDFALSEKLPKWHFNPCMKFFFFGQMTSFEVIEKRNITMTMTRKRRYKVGP
jgi:hypothetical protein